MQKKLAYRYKSYIAIGSNIGNWRSNFNNALNLMNKFGHDQIYSLSLMHC